MCTWVLNTAYYRPICKVRLSGACICDIIITGDQSSPTTLTAMLFPVWWRLAQGGWHTRPNWRSVVGAACHLKRFLPPIIYTMFAAETNWVLASHVMISTWLLTFWRPAQDMPCWPSRRTHNATDVAQRITDSHLVQVSNMFADPWVSVTARVREQAKNFNNMTCYKDVTPVFYYLDR